MQVKLITRCSGILALILFSCCSLFAQEKDVNGIIIDNITGERLPGAVVSIKGKPSNVSSGADGAFSIRVTPADSVLVFTYVGYDRIMYSLKPGENNITVRMRSNSADLNDVVVVGYGTQKRSNITGSVATVNVDQIRDMPVGNMTAMLRGSDNLPGVHVSGGQSRPGGAGTVVIRNPPNAAKDGGNNAPLYVIDDVVRSEADFNLLDPSEVASITILKDGAAAIYGARSGLGVVVVRTNRGKAGAPKVNVTSSYNVSDASYFPKMMNGYEFATYLNDVFIQGNNDTTKTGYYTQDELAYFKTHNYNWLDMAWKAAITNRESVNISGGNDKATYFAGASYYYQNGNLDKIDYNKWTFRASSDINISKNLKLGLSLNGVMAKNKQFFLKQGGEKPEKDVLNLLTTPQFVPPYIDGLPVELPGGTQSEGFHFFEGQRLDNYTLNREVQMNVNANLQYNVPFVKGLVAKVAYNRNLVNDWGKQYGTRYNVYPFTMEGDHNHIYGGTPLKPVSANNGDRIRINPDYSDAYQFNASLNYARQFGKHNISVLGVVEQSESYLESVSAMKESVVDVGVDYMRSAVGAMTTDNTALEAGTLSYVGRVDYNYAEKYIAQFSFRYDGSTKFAPDYRWGFFPAITAGWVISKENFMKNARWINFLKLRGSVGFMGTDRTADWSWSQRYTLQQSNGAVFGGNGDRNVGIKLENMPNPYARWDDIDKYNIGLDATFLDNRLNITQDAYYNHGHNLLTNLSASAPYTIGSKMPAENYATINSYGYEINVNWKGKIGREMTYFINTGWSVSNSQNVLIDVAPGIAGTWQDLTGRHTYNLGTEGYVYEGMFRTQAQVDDYLKSHPDYTIFGKSPEPGMLYYKDIRGPKQEDGTYAAADGIVTEDDQTYIKPKLGFSTGLSFGLSWKGLDLHVKSSFSVGGQTLVPGSYTNQFQARKGNAPAAWTDHWTEANPDARFPGPYYSDQYNVASSFWFTNSNSFSVDLINLSYRMPASVIKSLNVQGCRFFLVITNPIHFYNKELLGYNLTYPELRTYSLGVNLNL